MILWGGFLFLGGILSILFFVDIFPDVLNELGLTQMRRSVGYPVAWYWKMWAPTQLAIAFLTLGFVPWVLSETTRVASYVSRVLRLEITVIGVMVFLLSLAPGYGQIGHIFVGYMLLGLSLAAVGAVSLMIRPRLRSGSAWKIYSFISHCTAIAFLTPYLFYWPVLAGQASRLYNAYVYILQATSLVVIWGFVLLLETR